MQLSIFFNNLDHICNVLLDCPRWLVLDQFYDWLEQEQKLGKKCKTLIEKVVRETGEEMQSYRSRILLDGIAKKV